MAEMKGSGLIPDEKSTLVSILFACSHAGLVDQGLEILDSMVENWSIVPSLKHYACVIDFLARAGRLNDAYTMMKNIEMGIKISRKLFESSPNDVGKTLAAVANDEEVFDYDDGMDLPYEDPPLVCCFGVAQNEFVPTVRVAPEQLNLDIYSQWKMLQWNPPEFVRAPGRPPSNVEIFHARLGGRARFMEKVGSDEFGEEMVLMMNKEKVHTRGVKFDDNARIGCAYMKIKFEDGKMRVKKVKESDENSLLRSKLNLFVLKECVVHIIALNCGTIWDITQSSCPKKQMHNNPTTSAALQPISETACK
ncbi:Fructokinase-like protein 1 [Forsythia ovata]|uniref:Fructokinase-like protein 1 n=1 Tax=Forsythia ovata TaxID=205694 RepID=A0ABD1SLB6_9LAMI